MSPGVQAGLVQLGIAGLILVVWYSGAWGTIVDEVVAGILGGGGRAGRPRDVVAAPARTGSSLRAGSGGGGRIPEGV